MFLRRSLVDSHMSNKRVFYTLVLLGACAIAVSGFVLEGRRHTAQAPKSQSISHSTLNLSGTSTEVPLLATETRGDLKALVFAVRPTGFTPNETTVAEGRYLIVLQNRTRRRDLVFQIDGENGKRVKEVRQDRLDWKQQFDLQPGTYVISEANHSELRCVIRVTSR